MLNHHGHNRTDCRDGLYRVQVGHCRAELKSGIQNWGWGHARFELQVAISNLVCVTVLPVGSHRA